MIIINFLQINYYVFSILIIYYDLWMHIIFIILLVIIWDKLSFIVFFIGFFILVLIHTSYLVQDLVKIVNLLDTNRSNIIHGEKTQKSCRHGLQVNLLHLNMWMTHHRNKRSWVYVSSSRHVCYIWSQRQVLVRMQMEILSDYPVHLQEVVVGQV